MLVSLYTSRVVLEVLGIQNYGLWNLVATLIVSISFMTGPLSSIVQRFLSFEIGSNNTEKANIVFSQSIMLYGLFGLIIFLLLESVGLWLLNSKLQIPDGYGMIANVVYQLSIVSFFLTLVRTPYDAAIIAYEKMDFYAYISVLDALLKLGIVFLLRLFNHIYILIVYGCLNVGVAFTIFVVYKIYCNRKYKITLVRWKFEKETFKAILSYSGWTLLGAFSLMASNSGISLVLNSFFGVVINATVGVANQVGNAINQFVGNFQVAFQPSIVKTYAQNDIDKLKNLIYSTSKISFLLLFMISCPVILNIEPLLQLWLGDNVPFQSGYFCTLLLVSFILDALSAPLYMTVFATGKIRSYQVAISSLLILNILATYVLLKFGFPAITAMYVKCAISGLSLILRFIYVHNLIGLSLYIYLTKVIFPALFVAAITIGAGVLISGIEIADQIFLSLIIRIVIIFATFIAISYLFALNASERSSINNIILSKLHK